MSEEIITSNHWLIITNPRAGKRKFQEQSKYVRTELDKMHIPYLFKITEYSGHAAEIARYYAKRGCINFLVLGGDGSISEVINGIFASNIENTSSVKIALFPRGTGNDWGRFWNLKKNDRESLRVFIKGNTRLIDIGKMDYTYGNQPACRYFINSVGFGLDAVVAHLTHRLKKYMGSFSLLYTLSLLIALFKHKAIYTIVKISGIEHSFNLYSMNIANGPFSGGGIRQNPSANPYDGTFDMMVVEKPTLKDVVTALPLIFNGKLIHHPVIRSFQTKEMSVNIDKQTLIEADGIIIPDAHNCKITILPSAIKMIVP